MLMRSTFAHHFLCETRYGFSVQSVMAVTWAVALWLIPERLLASLQHSLSESLNSLTMRTFHVGGAVSRSAAQSSASKQKLRICEIRAHSKIR